MDVDRYLARIGYDGPRAPTLDVLGALQLAHVRAVPFENLDVYARTAVWVGRDWSIPKIVDRHRGGWCFELNGAFSALLDALGFAVTLHSGQVDRGDGVLGPALDHLVLLVALELRRFLVDVGFGDSALTPLDLAVTDPQDGIAARYRLAPLIEDDERAPDTVEMFEGGSLSFGPPSFVARMPFLRSTLAATAPASAVSELESLGPSRLQCSDGRSKTP